MPSTNSALHWRQIAPGRFERDLDDCENFMAVWANTGAAFNKKELLIHEVVQYESDRTDMIEALKTAWIAIRHHTPSMAAFFENGKSTYIQNEDLSDWLKETFIVSDSTVEEIFRTSAFSRRPELFVFPKTKEVMVRSHHERFDGTGSLLFFDKLFDFVESPPEFTFGDEHERLSLPMDVTMDIPETPDADANAYVQKALEDMVTPHVGLPARNLGQPAVDVEVEEIVLSEPETEAVIRACKAKGLTVTHGTHAAYILATQAIAGKSGNCLVMMPLCLRSVAGKHEKDFGVEQTTAEFRIVPPGDFSQTSQFLKEKYVSLKPATYNLARHKIVCGALTAAMSQPPPAPMTGPELSAIGIAERYMKPSHGRVELVNFRQLITTVTSQIRSSSYTFKGKYHMTASYNATYYRREDVRNFLMAFRRELHKGLGIEIKN